ncbi:helix-turn-helix domain-containing protein [Candidatus Avoscillospira sp. LCP25S3_F1]|jgi:transcriptional regulator with XRE-family HTH domain|uniref:helix-turn-helix domain-containing protein n=1 Tax=Candidatus Avoscillospira sp. LCP25S3_F1 TaxID=3438825 RepID=UPI003F8EF6AB
MYKNKAKDGKNNISGRKIKAFREAMATKPSQKELADLLQIAGLDVDKNAIQRIESGQRFVTDIELRVIAKVLNVSYEDLLDE